jgi:hypothetical protein
MIAAMIPSRIPKRRKAAAPSYLLSKSQHLPAVIPAITITITAT